MLNLRLSKTTSTYSIGTEAGHPPRCPLSWPGILEGDVHIFDFPAVLQAALVCFHPVQTNIHPNKVKYRLKCNI